MQPHIETITVQQLQGDILRAFYGCWRERSHLVVQCAYHPKYVVHVKPNMQLRAARTTNNETQQKNKATKN